jgi:hypothetical protein
LLVLTSFLILKMVVYWIGPIKREKQLLTQPFAQGEIEVQQNLGSKHS